MEGEEGEKSVHAGTREAPGVTESAQPQQRRHRAFPHQFVHQLMARDCRGLELVVCSRIPVGQLRMPRR